MANKELCALCSQVAEMKKVAALAQEQELSVEERNLLSVSYKNLVGARRASWRILQSIEQSEQAKGNEKRVKLIQKYRCARGSCHEPPSALSLFAWMSCQPQST